MPTGHLNGELWLPVGKTGQGLRKRSAGEKDLGVISVEMVPEAMELADITQTECKERKESP